MLVGRARRVALSIAVVCPAFALSCLDRPVSSVAPQLKASFSSVLKQDAIDKVDVLVVVDNSSSMADKQAYLSQAVPDLVARLVEPRCLPDGGGAPVARDGSGACPQGSKEEFRPVHDMHVGVISTSLGPRLGDTCDPNNPADPNFGKNHYDDAAHLLNRAGADEHAQAAMGTASYLAWLPPVPENAGKPAPEGSVALTDKSLLISAFQDAIVGVHQNGCGIESQLEAFYRFLVQPDPYDHLDGSSGRAAWVGVDSAILSQRKAFLRPDSLVVILALTDENDSEVDVRALGGSANLFMSRAWDPPRGASPCAVDPNDPACTSCALLGANAGSDPTCAKGPYSAWSDWGFDMNLRHVDMKQKYGLDVQYPLSRYVDGLRALTVPDRRGEYPKPGGGYVGQANCDNPLYAASLPDPQVTDPDALCHLPHGPRTPDMVYFAHIGGVPSSLLHVDPSDPAYGTVADADWRRILGKDPAHFDTSGIDPHMVESFSPRAGLPPPSAASNADPVSGREWLTDAYGRVDLEYACTFPLASPRVCADPKDTACDCAGADSRPSTQVPSVCDPASPTTQRFAKAYPTVRELELAKDLGTQGIVSSICPAHVTEQSPGDPLYGYRPAMNAIVDRLKSHLAAQCLPQPLSLEGDLAPCLVIEELTGGSAKSCADVPGLSALSPEAQKQFDGQRLAQGEAKTAAELPLACALAQIPSAASTSCESSTAPGWCYVKGGECAQAIRFSQVSQPQTGTKLTLECLEKY